MTNFMALFKSRSQSNANSENCRINCTIAAAALVLLSIGRLQAGVVTSFDGVSGTGLASMSFNNIFTNTTNNDNVVGTSDNLIAVNQKAYDAIGVIDMEFSVADSGGVTECQFSEGVDNSTGIDWTDYHVQLGFGTGTSFVKSAPGDGLDFDAPEFDSDFSFPTFATITPTEDDITAIDGLFLDGTFDFFVFTMDIPDGITSFTLRQFPTIAVPEPASAVLTLVLLIAAVAIGPRGEL